MEIRPAQRGLYLRASSQAPGCGPVPQERVELGASPAVTEAASPVSPPSCALATGGRQVSAQASAALVGGPAAVGLAGVLPGVEFRRRRLLFFWARTGLDTARQLASRGKPVQARFQEGPWHRLEGGAQLDQFRYFFGSAPEPDSLARDLKFLTEGGARFSAPDPLDPFAAYRRLSSGSGGVVARVGGREWSLTDAQDVRVTACALGQPDPGGLQHPLRAETLRVLSRAQALPAGNPLEDYYRPPRQREVRPGPVDLTPLAPEDWERPRQVEQRIQRESERLTGLQQALGAERGAHAFTYLRTHPGGLDEDTRSRVLQALYEGQTAIPARTVETVLRRLAQPPPREQELIQMGRAALEATRADGAASELLNHCADQGLAVLPPAYRAALALDGEWRPDTYGRLVALGPGPAGQVERLAGRPHSRAWTSSGTWKEGQDPSLGATWASGPYRPDENRQLEPPPLSLDGLHAATLSLQARHDLERNYDFLRIEASRDGQNWKELKFFTGTSDWKSCQVDLSEFEGGPLRLRFRLTSDHSNQGDGVELAGIRVRARDAAGLSRVVLDSEGSAAPASVLDRLERVGGPERALELERIEQAADRVGGLSRALDLMAELDPYRQTHDFDSKFQRALTLASRLGLGEARQLAPSLAVHGSLEAERQADLVEACLDLSSRLNPSLTPQQQGKQARAYLDSGLSLEQAGQLRSLAESTLDQAQAWKLGPPWALVADPSGGACFDDSPAGGYTKHSDCSLISPPLRLGAGSRLNYHLEADLEKNYDFLQVEVSEEGQGWQPLTRHTGAEAHDHQFDLSPWDGRSVRLQFRLTSDASTEGQGVRLSDLRVSCQAAGQPRQVVAAWLQGKAGLRQLSELAELPASERSARLARLDALLPTAGPQGALTLLDSPGWSSPGLAETASRLGVNAAVALWEAQQAAGGDPGQVEQAWEAAGELLRAVEEAPDLAVRAEIAGDLLRAGVRPQDSARLARAGAPSPDPWHPGPGWERTGEVWERRYKENEDSALTGPELDLTGLKGSQLWLRHGYDLEKNYDLVRLEVSPDGQTWAEAGRFTGRRPVGDELVDLSPYDGTKVRIRLRLTSDSSNQGEGYRLAGMVVRGNGPRGPALALSHLPGNGRLSARELTRALVSMPAGERSARVEELESVARRLGSLADARRLVESLPSGAGRADFREALCELNAHLGPEDARSARPLLDEMVSRGESPQTAARKLLEAFDLALRLGRVCRPAPERPRLTRLGLDLARAGLAPAEARALEELGRTAPAGGGWSATSPWTENRAEGLRWGTPRYSSNLDASLTGPELDLNGLSQCHLTFSAETDLEKGYDFVHVQVAEAADGPWKTVHSLTGQSAWSDSDVDLSAYDGKKVRLRFQLVSDGSNEGSGIQLGGVTLRGRRGGEWVAPLRYDAGRETFLDLLEAVVAETDPSRRAGSLDCIRRLVASSGSVEAAAGLWPAVASVHSSERTARTDGLGRLAAALGRELALELWPRVGPGPVQDLQARVDRAVELYQVSWALGSSLKTPPDRRQRLDFVCAQLASGLSPQDADRLAALVRAQQEAPDPVRHSKGWTTSSGPAGQPVWCTGSYRENADLQLPLGTVSLAGLESCFVSFEGDYDLEKGYDFLKLEAAEPGVNDWKPVASFTGRQPWGEHRAELAELAGKRVDLRLRLVSDASNQGEGARIRSLQVGGRAAGQLQLASLWRQETVAWEDLGRVLKPGSNPQRLDWLERMAHSMGLPAALKAVELLEPLEGQPAYRDQAEDLMVLARSLGSARALAVWPGLQQSGMPLREAARWAGQVVGIEYPGDPLELTREVVAEAADPQGQPQRLVRLVSTLPVADAPRVLAFLREKRQPGGPLEQLSLRESLEEFVAVIGAQVLTEDLDSVLELMLARHARGVEDRGDHVVVGGVSVKKKEAEDEEPAPD